MAVRLHLAEGVAAFLRKAGFRAGHPICDAADRGTLRRDDAGFTGDVSRDVPPRCGVLHHLRRCDDRSLGRYVSTESFRDRHQAGFRGCTIGLVAPGSISVTSGWSTTAAGVFRIAG
jgi:hypothetical protein